MKEYRISWEEHHTGIIKANSKEEAREKWNEDLESATILNSEITMIEIDEVD